MPGARVRQNSLRDLQVSKRHFWKPTVTEQITQVVQDQNADYSIRALTGNEITTLALNEIAAEKRRGFFMHLPSRLSWTTVPDSKRLPPERAPADPGHQYPTILAYDFVWDEQTYVRFMKESHRARYLRSSALINPPSGCTPLFALQYAFQRCPIFITATNSLVLFATSDMYYLADTTGLSSILGSDRKDANKLGGANWLWDRTSLDKGRDNRRDKDDAMNQYRQPSLEEVYFRIRADCFIHRTMPATYAAESLGLYIPRPKDLQAAASVGTPLGIDGTKSGDPFSRRGETRKSRKRRRLNEDDVSKFTDDACAHANGRKKDADDDENEDEDDEEVLFVKPDIDEEMK